MTRVIDVSGLVGREEPTLYGLRAFGLGLPAPRRQIPAHHHVRELKRYGHAKPRPYVQGSPTLPSKTLLATIVSPGRHVGAMTGLRAPLLTALTLVHDRHGEAYASPSRLLYTGTATAGHGASVWRHGGLRGWRNNLLRV